MVIQAVENVWNWHFPLETTVHWVDNLGLAAVTLTVATTGHAGKIEELSGQLMRMMLEMQQQQCQWMEMQQEKQQKWRWCRRNDIMTCEVDSKPKLPRPMLQKLTADDDNYRDFFFAYVWTGRHPAEIARGYPGNPERCSWCSYLGTSSRQQQELRFWAVLKLMQTAEISKRCKETRWIIFLERLNKLMHWSDASSLDVKEMEQFLESLPPKMRLWVMERKPSTRGAAAEIADDLDM